jgi:hypothetical protein
VAAVVNNALPLKNQVHAAAGPASQLLKSIKWTGMSGSAGNPGDKALKQELFQSKNMSHDSSVVTRAQSNFVFFPLKGDDPQ